MCLKFVLSLCFISPDFTLLSVLLTTPYTHVCLWVGGSFLVLSGPSLHALVYACLPCLTFFSLPAFSTPSMAAANKAIKA